MEYIIKSITNKNNNVELLKEPKICIGTSFADATRKVVLEQAYHRELKDTSFRVIIGSSAEWFTLDLVMRKADFELSTFPEKEEIEKPISKKGRPRNKVI